MVWWGFLRNSFLRLAVPFWSTPKGPGAAPSSRGNGAIFLGLGRGDWIALLVMALAVLAFGRHYWSPFASGIPLGIDLGDDLSFLGTLRSELLGSGRLLTWWSVAHDGIPLLGHPNTQVFYAPLVLPSLAFGSTVGARAVYVFSLLLAAGGMYALVRVLGPRPAVAAWAGLVFVMGGGIARISYCPNRILFAQGGGRP